MCGIRMIVAVLVAFGPGLLFPIALAADGGRFAPFVLETWQPHPFAGSQAETGVPLGLDVSERHALAMRQRQARSDRGTGGQASSGPRVAIRLGVHDLSVASLHQTDDRPEASNRSEHAVQPARAAFTLRARGLSPHGLVENDQRLRLNRQFALRPFARLRARRDRANRSGADAGIGTSRLFLVARETAANRAIPPFSGAQRYSLVLGADRFLAEAHANIIAGPGQAHRQDRLRAGLNFQEDDVTLFYGMTWFGQTRSSAPVGEVLGSFLLRLRF